MDRKSSNAAETESRYQVYADYNKLLRSWLVAYGIGAPILFATNDHVSAALTRSSHPKLLILILLSGVSLQILNAFINKWCAWQVYSGEYTPAHKTKRLYKIANRINDFYWLDLIFDSVTIILFAISTAWILTLFN